MRSTTPPQMKNPAGDDSLQGYFIKDDDFLH